RQRAQGPVGVPASWRPHPRDGRILGVTRVRPTGRRTSMTAVRRRSVTLALAIALAVCSPWLFGSSEAQQASRPAAPAIDADDIGGVVRGPNAPGAGVGVIAETRALPVRYIKIVVTNAQGGYVIPALPRGRYDVWVRGYGLVDSAKTASEPGKIVN